jgi:hypothetical protein
MLGFNSPAFTFDKLEALVLLVFGLGWTSSPDVA